MPKDIGRHYHALPELQDAEKQAADSRTKLFKICIIIALIFSLILFIIFILFFILEEKENLHLISPIKSPADTNEYGVYTLSNGLKVILVSDPKTDVSAASIDYGAGSYFDFFGIPKRGTKGLAHFHEHMLFLGSKEYPGEDDFTKLLSKYSGSDNAYTAAENTNFHFSCQNDGFHDVLKVWAAFFKSPLLTESSMNREMKAVHSEYTKDVPNAGWRSWTMMKLMARPDHPFHTFSIGTIDTLNITDIHKYLVHWHNKFFSSHIATLALYSKESLSTMKRWTNDLFHNIAHEPRGYPEVDGNPFPAERRLKMWYMKPLTESNTLDILWQIPPTLFDYQVPALEWIFSLINFSGPNGLKEMLVTKDLATSVGAEEGDTSRTFGLSVVSVSLTNKGLTKIPEVIGYVLQYIRLIADRALSEDWRFQEYTDLDALIWKFKTKPESRSGFVTSLASGMHFKNSKHVLYPEFTTPPSTYLWNKTLITSILDAMNARSLMLLVTTQDHDYSSAEKEEYFDVEYTVEDIALSQVEEWENMDISPDLSLKPKNRWTVHDTSVFPKSRYHHHPVVVYNETGNSLRGWFAYRVEKDVPTVYVSFILRNNFAYETVKSLVTTKMYSHLVAYHFGLEFTQAGDAGYHVGFDVGSDGLTIVFRGYHEHLEELITEMLALVLSPDAIRVTQEHFDSMKVQMNHSLRSQIKSAAYSQTRHTFSLLTQPVIYDWQPQIDALDELTIDDVSDFVEMVQGRVQTEYFVYGNANESYAAGVANLITPLINNTNVASNLTHLHIPTGVSIINRKNQNPSDKNSATDIYFQVASSDDMARKVIMSVISPVFHEKCFDRLRTKETLGYIVSAAGTVYDHVLYQRIVVVGPNFDATHFLERSFVFLQSFYDEYINDELTESVLEDLKQATMKKYSRKDLSVGDWQGRFWGEIESTTYDWNYRAKLIEMVKRVTLENVRAYYREVFLNKETRRVLAVQLFSPERDFTFPSNLTYTTIDSLNVFADDPAPYFFEVSMRDPPLPRHWPTKIGNHSLHQ